MNNIYICSMGRNKEIYCSNRSEWHGWLAKNSMTETGVWLIYYKKHTGKPRVSYDDAVEEAICFGWIDSTIQRMDDERYRQKFTPRNRESKWSAHNVRRANKMIREGKMMKKQWYEELFQNYAEHYDREPFTQGTTGEVDFIEQEINFNRDLKILDIGCGTGRHAIELAKRGYAVTGLDLSVAQLARAREKAEMEKVNVDFQEADARNLAFSDEFDLVIMICEGGFSLMETDEMNYAILESASRALKKGGILILTCLNALFPLYHSVKEFMEKNEQKSGKNSFDLMTLRDQSNHEITDDDGSKMMLNCNERYFLPSEITWYLQNLRFENIGIYGCKLGNFSRKDPLTTEDFEMLVVAEKS